MIYDPARSLAERVYRVMLLAYRPGFRQRYGQEMIEAFREGQRERRQADGVRGLAQFWMSILTDWSGSSLFRFYFPTVGVLAFLVCWISFSSDTSTPPEHRNPADARVALAKPLKADAIVPERYVATRIGRKQSGVLHISARRDRWASQSRLFALAGPAALAEGTTSVGPHPKVFSLIGQASIKRVQLVELTLQVPE